MAGGAQGAGASRGYANGGFAQSQYNNFASPNQNFSALSSQLPSVQGFQGPDITGNLSGGGMGFDNSGSDAGVGGQPVNQMQTPVQRFADGGFAQQAPQYSTGMVPPQPAGGFGQQAPQYGTGMVPPQSGGFGQQAPAGGGFGQQNAMANQQANQFNQQAMNQQAMNQQRAQALQQTQQADLAALARARGNRPPSLADFRPQRGFQVHGNPTSQIVGRQRFQ